MGLPDALGDGLADGVLGLPDAAEEAFGLAAEFAPSGLGGGFGIGEVLAGGVVDLLEGGIDAFAVVLDLEVEGGGAHGFAAGELPSLRGEDIGEEAGEVSGLAGKEGGAGAEVQESARVVAFLEDVGDEGLELIRGWEGAAEGAAPGSRDEGRGRRI
jgi:hypothetical protein